MKKGSNPMPPKGITRPPAPPEPPEVYKKVCIEYRIYELKNDCDETSETLINIFKSAEMVIREHEKRMKDAIRNGLNYKVEFRYERMTE